MGREHFYKGNDPYKIDARTGFAVRASTTRKEWTGQIVRERSWEPRQPQDFVRGSVDDQTVPEPRPRLPQRFIPTCTTVLVSDGGSVDFDGIGYFTIGRSIIGDPSDIAIALLFGWLTGDVIWIMMDNGNYFRTEVTAIDGNDISIDPPLILGASAGNVVLNISAEGRLFGGAYPGTIGALAIGPDGIGLTSLDVFGPAPESNLNDQPLEVQP